MPPQTGADFPLLETNELEEIWKFRDGDFRLNVHFEKPEGLGGGAVSPTRKCLRLAATYPNP